MRLIGQIQITMATAEAVHREPGFWDKLKRGMGGKVDLDTGQVRVALEATALVDQVKRAFGRLGIDNAVSLVVDDTIIFQDIEGRAGDLPDLILALSEHASVFGRGFREMKLAVEHEEASLHLLVEVRALHSTSAASRQRTCSVGGRIRDLEPTPGRVGGRLPRARRAAGARTPACWRRRACSSSRSSAAWKRRCARRCPRRRSRRSAPTRWSCARRRSRRQPAQDPRSPITIRTRVYYPSPMGTMLDVMLISSFMHMMMPPPMIMVVHPSGAPIGSADTIKDHPEAVEASAERSGRHVSRHDGDHGGDGDDGDTMAATKCSPTTRIRRRRLRDGGGFDGGGFDGGDFAPRGASSLEISGNGLRLLAGGGCYP